MFCYEMVPKVSFVNDRGVVDIGARKISDRLKKLHILLSVVCSISILIPLLVNICISRQTDGTPASTVPVTPAGIQRALQSSPIE